jgi:hypothetical protein
MVCLRNICVDILHKGDTDDDDVDDYDDNNNNNNHIPKLRSSQRLILSLRSLGCDTVNSGIKRASFRGTCRHHLLMITANSSAIFYQTTRHHHWTAALKLFEVLHCTA